MAARLDEGFPELLMMSFYHQMCVRSTFHQNYHQGNNHVICMAPDSTGVPCSEDSENTSLAKWSHFLLVLPQLLLRLCC